MKLTYWVAHCLNDSPAYSIRCRTKREVRRVHEQLLLNAVPLQAWINNATPDTDGGCDDVLGWNDHVVFVLHPGQWFPAVKPEKVWQENRVTKSDFSVLTGGTR